MTDPRRDTIARALYARPHLVCRCRESECPRIEAVADAVLAALPEYEQVGWLRPSSGDLRALTPPPFSGWVPVCIVREDTAPKIAAGGAESMTTPPTDPSASTPTPAAPTVCPTCGSDDPPWIVSSRGKEPALCPDPFHSPTVPCPECEGTGFIPFEHYSLEGPEFEPCPRGCTPEGAAP